MDIVKRLISRVTKGPYWVMPGGFGKNGGCPRKRDGGPQGARVSTVYATNDDLVYVARCTDQMMFQDTYSPYDMSMFIAFATPELIEALLEYFEDTSDGMPDTVTEKVRNVLEERIEFLNRDYVEPEVES